MSLGHMPKEAQFGWWVGMMWLIGGLLVSLEYNIRPDSVISFLLLAGFFLGWFAASMLGAEMYVKLFGRTGGAR